MDTDVEYQRSFATAYILTAELVRDKSAQSAGLSVLRHVLANLYVTCRAQARIDTYTVD